MMAMKRVFTSLILFAFVFGCGKAKPVYFYGIELRNTSDVKVIDAYVVYGKMNKIKASIPPQGHRGVFPIDMPLVSPARIGWKIDKKEYEYEVPLNYTLAQVEGDKIVLAQVEGDKIVWLGSHLRC